MQLVINISEEEYNCIKKQVAEGIDNPLKVYIANGTPIPKGVTNGDMIKAMFPNAKIERGLYGIDGMSLICLNLGTRHDVHEMSFVEDWWNAPYKM